MMRMFAVGVLLAATLSGCGIGSTPTPDEPVDTGVQNPVAIPDGVLATGQLTSVAGEVLGEVHIVRDGYRYRLELPDFEPLDERVQMPVLSDSPFEATECGDANIWQLGFGDETTVELGLDANTFPSGDWSFFTALLIIGYPNEEAGADPAGCTQPILATAPLTWEQPIVRPWVDPVDSGSAEQANGTVDGTLYTTAAGDNFDAIAARFGITGPDLEWLNPIRTPGQTRQAYADQVLNLDPDDRSDSESRRP